VSAYIFIQILPFLAFYHHSFNFITPSYQSYSKKFTMLFKYILLHLIALLSAVTADSAGYVLPSSGTASTTQFYLGPELSSGTACGVDALPNGASTSGKQGGGPGYLYVFPLPLSIPQN
jgi:hypothetical protein